MAVASESAAFYCVADDRYFTGAAALINSLRLVGHRETIFMLDCGLTGPQRELVQPQVTLLERPSDTPPWLLKTVAPLERPAEAMVLLDTDLVATRSLAPLIDLARAGRLAAFRNPDDRYVAEWGELLELGPQRRQHYLSSAAIFTGRLLGEQVLGLLDDRQRAVDFELTHWRQDVRDYPFLYADQDVFNAILATRVEPRDLVVLESRLAPTPPFAGLTLADELTLRCRYDDGAEPWLVHHHTVKPWLEPTHHGVYSQLLRRLLIGDDVAIRVPREQIPLRLRGGLRAYAARKRINARERFRWHVREPLRARGKRTHH